MQLDQDRFLPHNIQLIFYSVVESLALHDLRYWQRR